MCSRTFWAAVGLSLSFVCGVAFLIAGAALVASGYGDRGDNIDAVDNAVDVWNDNKSFNGRYHFSTLVAFATLTAGSGAFGGNCWMYELSLPLLNSQCDLDQYEDERNRYQRVTQRKYCTRVDYAAFVNCDLRVEVKLFQPSALGVQSLIAIPDYVSPITSQLQINMNDIGGGLECEDGICCCTGRAICRWKCEAIFDGSFDCPWKCYANAYVGDLGVRVSFAPGGVDLSTSGLNFTYGGVDYYIPPGNYSNVGGSLNGTWQLNNTWPPLGDGNQTAGANVLRQGFQWNIWTGPRSGDAPLWQYDSTVFYQPPNAITVTVRSAFDPYLMYMSRTGGSGWLGADRTTVLIFASCFIAFGSICILVTLIVGPCLCWGKGLVSKSPFKKPDGMAGMAWECAMGCCPPHRISPEQMPPSAANQTSPNIIYPVAAPVMVPGPYPPAGPGGYPPGPEGHPPPGGHPPQHGGPPPGYPPPPPGQPAAAGHPPGYPSPGPSPGPAAGPPAGGGAPPSVPTPAAPPPGHLAPLGPPAQSPSMRR